MGQSLSGPTRTFAQGQNADTAATEGTPRVLPRSDFKFQGKVGKTYKESDPPQFPQPVKAPKGAPNVVLILLLYFPRFGSLGR